MKVTHHILHQNEECSKKHDLETIRLILYERIEQEHFNFEFRKSIYNLEFANIVGPRVTDTMVQDRLN